MTHIKLDTIESISQDNSGTTHITINTDRHLSYDGNLAALGRALCEREEAVLEHTHNSISTTTELKDAINATIDEDLDWDSDIAAESFAESGTLNEIWQYKQGDDRDVEETNRYIEISYTKSSYYSEQDIAEYLEELIRELKEEDKDYYNEDIERYEAILATA